MLVTPNTVVGIQARTSSSRFPGKVLELISGKPVIEWVINNCQLSGFEVFVLTSNHPSDNELVSFLVQENINYYRGDLNNVLSRFLNFMETNSIDKIIRISADSPLIHSGIIKKVAEDSRSFPEYDLITNVYPRTYPKGQSVEVISKQSLQVINELDLSREQILNNLNNDNRRRILYLLLLQIQRQRNRSFNFGFVPPPPPPGQLIPPRAYVPSKSGKISKKNIRKLRPKCQQYIREIKDIYFQNMDKLIELRNTVDYTNYTLFKRIFNLLPNDYNISPLRRSLHHLARLFIMNNCEYSDDNYRHFRNNLDYRNINHLNKVLHDIYIYYTITDSVYTTAISNLNLNLN
jgi:spore coat polysaccharide biosynthesis protein SpsF (cytidylyltransferase family)